MSVAELSGLRKQASSHWAGLGRFGPLSMAFFALNVKPMVLCACLLADLHMQCLHPPRDQAAARGLFALLILRRMPEQQTSRLHALCTCS